MPYCQQLRRAFTALDVLMYYSQSQCQVRWKLNDQLMSFRILARKTQKKTIDIVGAFLTEITTEEVLQLAMMADGWLPIRTFRRPSIWLHSLCHLVSLVHFKYINHFNLMRQVLLIKVPSMPSSCQCLSSWPIVLAWSRSQAMTMLGRQHISSSSRMETSVQLAGMSLRWCCSWAQTW